MQYVHRTIESVVKECLIPNKVVVLLGPRRVGKTVLINQILNKSPEPYVLLNGEDISTQELFERRSKENYLQLLDNKLLLVIDEAQKIPDIGNSLKLMIDSVKGLKILVTGSSAFDMQNFTGEPITGRKYTINLYALSDGEYDQIHPLEIRRDKLRERLIYGNYPELLQLETKEEKSRYLNELINSYLLKDILKFDNIRNSDKIIALLRLLAFQIGSTVSTTEIGRQLGMSGNTVTNILTY